MTTPVTKLEIGVVLRGAFGFVFESIPDLIRAAFIPFLVSVVVGLVFTISYSHKADLIVNPMELMADPEFFYALLFHNVANGIASIVFACSWHRSTLLGHDRPRTGIGFFLGRLEMIYLFRFVLVVLIIVPFFFGFGVLVLPLFASFGSPLFIALGLMFMVMMVVYLYARLTLCLPAAAIGHLSFGLINSRRATSAVQWQLLLSHLVFYLIVLTGSAVAYLIISVLVALVFGSSPFLLMFAQVFILGVITFFATACATSFLSWVYGQLGEKPNWVG